MKRSFLHALALLTFLAWAGSTALAQTADGPVDPLVRVDEISGQYELTLGLAYIPDGEEGMYLSDHGPVAYTQSRHQAQLSLRLRHFLSTSSSVLLSLSPGLMHSVVASSTHGTRATSSETETNIGASFGIRHRLAPRHLLDPAITISLQLPSRTADLNLSGSWIRDPVVLSGSLSHAINMETNARHLTMNLGTGLFLNDKIRFKVNAQHAARVDSVSLPEWGFSLGAVYALDLKGASDVYVGIHRTERGGRAITSLVVEWYGLFAGW